jgi:toxin HigB-1
MAQNVYSCCNFGIVVFSFVLHGYRESDIICVMAIRSFGDPATADLYHGRNTARSRRFPQAIVSVALRKIDVLNAAHKLDDLRSPPGNRLEALKGDLEGLYSIRVNAQWRITFRWNDGVHEVSLVDYH